LLGLGNDDRFGNSVAIDDDAIVVGAPHADGGTTFSGAAYVYYRDQGGLNQWGWVKTLVANDAASGDRFNNVSIGGDLVIVGAHESDPVGPGSGSAYIFARDYGGADSWGQAAKLIANDGAVGDYLGVSVGISRDIAIVGASGDDDAGSQSGSAYIFAGLSDCNTNGALDTCDLVDGSSQDANNNGTPDECENQPPEAICQDVTVDADGTCQAVVLPEDVDGGSFDPDGDPISLALDPPGPYPLGGSDATLTVSDPSYAQDTCTATITVEDHTPPLITCPADTSPECPADTGVDANGEAVASDNCGSSVTHSDALTPGCGETLTIVRSWTAVDGAGNVTPCDQTIAVVDTTPPTISTPAADQAEECDGGGNVDDLNNWLISNGGAVASDACGNVTWGNDYTALSDDCGATGSATVTFTATDECNNDATTMATFTIADITAPVLLVDTTPIVVTDVDCSGGQDATLPTASGSDDCGAVTITNDAPAIFPAGQTTTVTYTAADDCNNQASDTMDVTVLYGADILVKAAKHTVGSGSHPGSTKEPLVGIEVCAYDKADGSCARTVCGGIAHQHYQCIVENCGTDDGELIFCCTTDADGECTINTPPGDYIVISADATKTVLPDPLGVSASDLVCGEVKQKHLQQIVKANGQKVPGKTTRRTGSELLIIEPEYVLWDDTTQLYPFVFETVGDWGVTTTVAPPDGFVTDYDELSEDVDNEIEAVQFTITEVGSDLVPTETTFQVRHNGRSETIRSRVDIRLTSRYAQSRGFNVAALRAQGLIKERPDNPGQARGRGNPHNQ
jgi:hypothetical protein